MELQRVSPRPFVPTWRKIARSGLGADPGVNVTTMWTPSGGYVGSTPAAVYQAPAHVPVPACIQDTRPGGAAFSGECQAQLRAANDANIAADAGANRAVFVQNCNRDWQANAERYRQLGMAVPPNDCDYRGYGLTPAGSTGGYSGYVAGTPQNIIDWRNANPGGGSPGPAAGGAGPANSAGARLAFTNLTSGDNTNFKVGDRWEIVISGAAPNAPVSMNGGKDGANSLFPMGNTDASGTFRTNGQMGQGEIGSWSEAWRVNNQIVSSFSFRVSPSGSVTNTTAGNTGGGQTVKTTPSVFDTLPGGSIQIGGNDIPVLALGAAAIVAFFLFKGGR